MKKENQDRHQVEMELEEESRLESMEKEERREEFKMRSASRARAFAWVAGLVVAGILLALLVLLPAEKEEAPRREAESAANVSREQTPAVPVDSVASVPNADGATRSYGGSAEPPL